MARFGISGIIEKRKEGKKSPRIIVKQRVQQLHTPTWVKNISFQFSKEAKMMLSGSLDVHDYLARLFSSNDIVITEIEGFVSNGVSVDVSKLYPGFDSYFVAFSKYGYELQLLTIGSKTIDEFRAAGHDTYLKSRVPLILTIQHTEHNGKRFAAVNLDTFLTDTLTQTKGASNG